MYTQKCESDFDYSFEELGAIKKREKNKAYKAIMYKIIGGQKTKIFEIPALSYEHALQLAKQIYFKNGLIGRYYLEDSEGNDTQISGLGQNEVLKITSKNQLLKELNKSKIQIGLSRVMGQGNFFDLIETNYDNTKFYVHAVNVEHNDLLPGGKIYNFERRFKNVNITV